MASHCFLVRNKSKLFKCKAVVFQIVLHAVEKDPEIVNAAKKWFDCVEDDRLRFFTEDEQEFIEQASTKGNIYIILTQNTSVCETGQGSLFWTPMKLLDYI
jgi:hypothetical protein